MRGLIGHRSLRAVGTGAVIHVRGRAAMRGLIGHRSLRAVLSYRQ
jgi:hypothetical protein